MTTRNACASRSAAFTMRNPTPGKSAASSPSKDCAASPSSTQGATVATCDQKRANRTRQISSGTVTAPPTQSPFHAYAPSDAPDHPPNRGGRRARRREGRRKRPAGHSHAAYGAPLVVRLPRQERTSQRDRLPSITPATAVVKCRELVGRAAMLRGRIITTTSLGANGALANCGRGGNPHATARPTGRANLPWLPRVLGSSRRRRGAVAGSRRVAGACLVLLAFGRPTR